MPKPLNPKCSLCACLPAAQARVIHGPQGDGCWDDQHCYNRRSFYRRKRQQAEANSAIETIRLRPPESHFAVLYLYKESGDRPLHALGAELWHGQQAICRLEAVHCFGLTAGKIRTYTDRVLKAFAEQYGVTLNQYKEMFELSPTHCPVRPCPLHPETL